MNQNVRRMAAIALLQGMVFYGPVATLYRQAQGLSVFDITRIESLSMALCIALEIPWGIIADRIGYRKTLIFCSGLAFLSKIVFWLATDFEWFLAERVMLSIVQSGTSGVDVSILCLSCDESERQKAFGLYNAMGMAGLLFAAVIFSLFIQSRYRLAGFLTAVSYGAAMLLATSLVEVRPKPSAHHVQRDLFLPILRQTLRNRHLLLFLVAVALLSETHQTITVFLGQLQLARVGLSDSGLGFIFIITTLVGTSAAFSSLVTQKLGEHASVAVLCGAALASCMALALVPLPVAAVSGIWLLRLSYSLFQPLQIAIQNRQIQTAHRATALSIHAMLGYCLAIGTNLVFGTLSEISLAIAFVFGGGLCLISLLLLLCSPNCRKD